jgi:hypothetical protein
MLVDPWTDAPPDLRQLCRELNGCGVAADQIPQTAQRLARPPRLFGLSALHDPEMLSRITIQLGADAAKNRRGFDGDMAARLLSLDKRRPDLGATWKALSDNEKKQAKRLWVWLGKHHGLSSTPRGRPPELDAALVLYCARVLCEASGRDRFKFRRPTDGGKPDGPMWRALIEALPIAQRFLARRYRTPALTPQQIDAAAESIAEIVTLARSEGFANWSQEFGLGFGSHDVADAPASFRAAMMYARKKRRSARKSRPRKRRA